MPKRLITERDVAARTGRDPIVVDDETIVTPSALDLAHGRGIPVLFTRGGASLSPRATIPAPVDPLASAPASDPRGSPMATAHCERCGGLASALLSRDGTYLVRVEGGRGKAFRVTPSGVEPVS